MALPPDDIEHISGEDDYQQPRSLRLHEERLEVSKENVQTGEVQLHKYPVTEQKTMQVSAIHEEVIIEHRLMKEGTMVSTTIGEEETIRIPILAEQISVAKIAITTGEVKIGKQVIEQTRHVSEMIRREEPRLQLQGEVPIQSTSHEPLAPDHVSEKGT